jgi:two-component system, sensor histidine kinase and response regulator
MNSKDSASVGSGSISTTEQVSGRVLVVDDDPAGRQLLRDIVEAEGHEVTEAESGQAAIDLLFDTRRPLPNAVLLDILMPGIDGFETCRRIKANQRTSHVPVIVVTALNDRTNRLEAIRAGANDYFSKPIDADEVALRVRNAVEINRLFNRVQDNLFELQELQALRDVLIHMMVHDMRQPITALLGFLHVLSMHAKGSENGKVADMCREIAERLAAMVDSVLDIQKMERGQLSLELDEVELGEFAEAQVSHFLQSPFYERTVTFAPPERTLRVLCDRHLIQRVLFNLIDNAIKYTPSGKSVRVSVDRRADAARVSVADSGPGIAAEYHNMIFEKFGQVRVEISGLRPSWGLGLAFCKMAVTAHNGSIGVDSMVGSGSTFWFELPLAAKG